jgi:hypothetical protein
VKQTAPITVTAVKVAIPLRPHQIPRDLVPPEPAPAGTPVLRLQLEGTDTTVTAQLNGKSCRKLLKQIAEYGPDNTSIILQGNLKPGLMPGSFTLEGAGFQAFNKAPTQPTGPSQGTVGG